VPTLSVGVLTNAHVVSDQTFVQVRRHGSSVKYQARVYAVGHDCDLAVLTVDDPKFFADSTAISTVGRCTLNSVDPQLESDWFQILTLEHQS
jgi:S1-C subfamily serine protease